MRVTRHQYDEAVAALGEWVGRYDGAILGEHAGEIWIGTTCHVTAARSDYPQVVADLASRHCSPALSYSAQMLGDGTCLITAYAMVSREDLAAEVLQ